MTDYTLTIPSDLYKRAEKIAQITTRPVSEILLEQIRLWSDNMPLLDEGEEGELQALKYLSDDALRTIASETMSSELKATMQALMDKHHAGTISTDEHAKLSQLVERSERMMLRKSEATALLSQRGFNISEKDLSTRD